MKATQHHYLKLNEVLERFRFRKSKLYADIQRGLFPRPEKHGGTSMWSVVRIEAHERKLREQADR